MGILSAIAGGAVQGLGTGMSSYYDTEEHARLRNEDREDRQAFQRAMLEERLGARGAGGGSGSRGGGNTSLSDLASLDDTKLARLRQMGGMTRDRAADLREMEAGRQPGTDVDMPASRFTNPDRIDDASDDPKTQRVAKYTPGQGAELAQQGFMALRRAVGLGNPQASDDIAKAEGTEQTTANVKAYRDGDPQAGRAALVGQGKAPYNEDGDVVTGAAPKGTVAGATVNDKDADAELKRAKAKSETGGEGGAGKVQSTKVDGDGYVVAIFKNGTSKRIEIDGQPVKSGEYAKRVDKLASDLRKTPAYFNSKPDELRQAAEDAIRNGSKSDAKPAADKFTVGKVYRDSTGARATYLGNGKWSEQK